MIATKVMVRVEVQEAWVWKLLMQPGASREGRCVVSLGRPSGRLMINCKVRRAKDVYLSTASSGGWKKGKVLGVEVVTKL